MCNNMTAMVSNVLWRNYHLDATFNAPPSNRNCRSCVARIMVRATAEGHPALKFHQVEGFNATPLVHVSLRSGMPLLRAPRHRAEAGSVGNIVRAQDAPVAPKPAQLSKLPHRFEVAQSSLAPGRAVLFQKDMRITACAGPKEPVDQQSVGLPPRTPGRHQTRVHCELAVTGVPSAL